MLQADRRISPRALKFAEKMYVQCMQLAGTQSCSRPDQRGRPEPQDGGAARERVGTSQIANAATA